MNDGALTLHGLSVSFTGEIAIHKLLHQYFRFGHETVQERITKILKTHARVKHVAHNIEILHGQIFVVMKTEIVGPHVAQDQVFLRVDL